MATRFRESSSKQHPTGYTGPTCETFTIPPCGIRDVDKSLFDMFEKELRISVGKAEEEIKKVPVIFASGEKWAMIKNNRQLRDRNGTLILPLITIVRTSVQQSPQADITGRGINQQTGEIIIKKRLDESDRDYQKLINRLFLTDQENLAIQKNEYGHPIETSRQVGDMSGYVEIRSGAFFKTNRKKHVWEIIKIPSPQFITMNYNVTFWAQYVEHMNQMIDLFVSSLIVPGQHLVLETNKGYWFVATMNTDTFEFETNFDDQRSSERLIKTNFSLKVPAYILASDSPGAPIPVRRYISAPEIEFTTPITNDDVNKIYERKDEIHLLEDDPTSPVIEQPLIAYRKSFKETIEKVDDLFDNTFVSPFAEITIPVNESIWSLTTDGVILTVSGNCSNSSSVLVEINNGSTWISFGSESTIGLSSFSIQGDVSSYLGILHIRAISFGSSKNVISESINITIEN